MWDWMEGLLGPSPKQPRVPGDYVVDPETGYRITPQEALATPQFRAGETPWLRDNTAAEALAPVAAGALPGASLVEAPGHFKEGTANAVATRQAFNQGDYVEALKRAGLGFLNTANSGLDVVSEAAGPILGLASRGGRAAVHTAEELARGGGAARREAPVVKGLLEAEPNARAVTGDNGGPPIISDYSDPAHSLPRYVGAAPDRTTTSLVRYNPKRGTTERTADALAAMRENRNGVKDQMLADIKAGQALKGDSWYNTEELRDWFVKELGPERGHNEWSDFMDLMGATSTGNKVPTNIATASYYRNKGPEWVRENVEGLLAGGLKDNPDITPLKGYGHKMQNNHGANVGNLYSGGWDPATTEATKNPKPRGFSQSLRGSEGNIAADLHFTRYMGMASGRPDWLDNSTQVSQELVDRLTSKYGAEAMAPYISGRTMEDGKPVFNFRPKKAVTDGVIDLDEIRHEPAVWSSKPNNNEYRAFENYMQELGKELGMTAPQVQANLWMGASKRTGLADESQGSFMELFRKRADERAAKETKATKQPVTREDVIRRFIRERGLVQNEKPPGLLGPQTMTG